MSGYINGLVVCQIANLFNNLDKFRKIVKASSSVSGSPVTKMSLDLHSGNWRNWKAAVGVDSLYSFSFLTVIKSGCLIQT